MKERPIIKGHEIAGRMPLFKLPLRDAIREDRKSMTRRVIKPQPDEDGLSRLIEKWLWQDTSGRDYICPHGIPGQFRVMTEPYEFSRDCQCNPL